MESLDAVFLKGLDRERAPHFYPRTLPETDRGQIGSFTYDNDRFFTKVHTGPMETNALSRFAALSENTDMSSSDADSGEDLQLSATSASHLLLRKATGDAKLQLDALSTEFHPANLMLIRSRGTGDNSGDLSFNQNLSADAYADAAERRDLFSDFSQAVLDDDKIPEPGKLEYFLMLGTDTRAYDFGIARNMNKGF